MKKGTPTILRVFFPLKSYQERRRVPGLTAAIVWTSVTVGLGFILPFTSSPVFSLDRPTYEKWEPATYHFSFSDLKGTVRIPFERRNPARRIFWRFLGLGYSINGADLLILFCISQLVAIFLAGLKITQRSRGAISVDAWVLIKITALAGARWIWGVSLVIICDHLLAACSGVYPRMAGNAYFVFLAVLVILPVILTFLVGERAARLVLAIQERADADSHPSHSPTASAPNGQR